MTIYTTQVDKNGKTLYYRMMDGKKKNISRAEYEANRPETDDYVPNTTSLESEARENEVMSAEEQKEYDEFETQYNEWENTAEEYVSPAQMSLESEPTIEVAEVAEPAEEGDAEKVAAKIVRESGEVETSVFDFVKNVVEETDSKYANKMCLHNSQKCVLVAYRNRVICSLVFDKEHKITKIRFVGDTIETRKTAYVYDFDSSDDLAKYKGAFVKQIEFVDWWYQNPKAKAVSAA